MPQELKTYELVNPSDPYTFKAPSIEVAGVCAFLLSEQYGAREIGGDGEQTPVMFGWEEWLRDRKLSGDWMKANRLAVADAYDSFLIGSHADREDTERAMSSLSDDEREAFRNERQDRMRTSMAKIGEVAYANAKAMRDC